MDVKELYVLLTANTSQFKAAMGEASAESDGLMGKLGGLAKAALAVGVAGAAAGAGFAVYALKEADSLDAANAALAEAAKVAGTSMAKLAPVVAQADKSMESLGFTHAATTAQMAKMVEAHIPLNKQMAVLTAAANLAAVKHIDLDSAMHAVLLSAQGNARALKEYGVVIQPAEAGVKQLELAQRALSNANEKLAEDMDKHKVKAATLVKDHEAVAAATAKVHDITVQLNDRWQNLGTTLSALNIFQGQAKTQAETLAGQMEVLKSRFADWAATIGEQLMPYALAFTDWIGKTAVPDLAILLDWFDKKILPTLVELSGWIQYKLVPSLVSFGSALVTYFITPAGILGTVVLPPLITALGGLMGNLEMLVPFIAMAATAWTAYKVAMIGQDVIQGISLGLSALSLALDGVGVAEAVAATGATGLAAALDVALGPIGLAVGILSLVVGDIVAIGMSSDKTSAQITGMALTSSDAAAQMAQDWHDNQTKQQRAALNAYNTIVGGYVNAKDQARINAAGTTQEMQAAYAQQKADAIAHFKAIDPKDYAVWKNLQGLADRVNLTSSAYLDEATNSNVSFVIQDRNTKALILDQEILNRDINSAHPVIHPGSPKPGGGGYGGGTSTGGQIIGLGHTSSGSGSLSVSGPTIHAPIYVKSTDPRQAAIEIRDELLNLARSQGKNSLFGSFA